MIRFAGATLGLVALLGLALAFGGVWVILALLYVTVFTFFMDKISSLAANAVPAAQEFPASTPLSVVLALAHFGLLVCGVWVLAMPGSMAVLDKVLCFVALSLFFGQVSNSNAHELIHRPARGLRRLGMWVYISLLFGHHTSAHTRVHHVHVATDRDPNSARMGEGFYRYAARAWIGSYREGHLAEAALRAKGGGGAHPYRTYIGGAVLCVGLAAVLGGIWGVVIYLGLAGYAQLQLLLSDYVQHYGLRRSYGDDGRLEPVAARHSWNAPNWFSSALMLNAPRHSDHHAHPSRHYPALELSEDMPELPHSLPVMAVIALWPALWRRVMDRRAKRWQSAA